MEKPDFDEGEKTPTQDTFDKSVKANSDSYPSLSKADKTRAVQEIFARRLAQKVEEEERRKGSEKLVQKIAHYEQVAEKARRSTLVDSSGTERAALDHSSPTEKLEMLEPKTYSPRTETARGRPLQRPHPINAQRFLPETGASRLLRPSIADLFPSYRNWPASPSSPNNEPVIGADGLVTLTPYMSTNRLNAVSESSRKLEVAAGNQQAGILAIRPGVVSSPRPRAQ